MKKNKSIKLIMFLYLVMFGFKTVVFADNQQCKAWGDALQDLQNLFNLLKIAIPLLVIGLSSYDFIKAITSKEAKDVKRAYQTFLKRLILAVVFFFLPTLINLFLSMAGVNSTVCVK